MHITFQDNKLNVPNDPTILYIEGDGIGIDITPVMINVVNAAVNRAYNQERKIDWQELIVGEKAVALGKEPLPQESLDRIQQNYIAIKGPLATPKGKGARSLNVAIRQKLDLYTCLRPVKWFKGVPSPVKEPHNINMVVFRENTEDIYAGIDWDQNNEHSKQKIDWLLNGLKENFPDDYSRIRFPGSTGIGIKPVSIEGSVRLIKAAIQYAIDNDRSSVTLVAKGNIMKYTEGLFVDAGYKIVENNLIPNTSHKGEREKNLELHYTKNGEQKIIEIKDAIADAFLQQILTRPKEYDVIATLNLNGDYISDALAAQVGGIGIAPGANINYNTGHAVFEATHGTAPKYTGQNKVNPSSIILSAVMMLEYLGWQEAADLITKGIEAAIQNKTVTYDFERLMEHATLVSCSEFGQKIIDGF